MRKGRSSPTTPWLPANTTGNSCSRRLPCHEASNVAGPPIINKPPPNSLQKRASNSCCGSPVDGFAGLIELAARQPLVAGRVEVPGRLQVPVGRAHVPPDVELEDPERVPGLRVLRLELDGLRVPLLGRARESLALGDVRERQHRRRRVWVERTGRGARSRSASPKSFSSSARSNSRRLRSESRGDANDTSNAPARSAVTTARSGRRRTAPGGRPAPTSTPRAKSVGAVAGEEVPAVVDERMQEVCERCGDERDTRRAFCSLEPAERADARGRSGCDKREKTRGRPRMPPSARC